MKIYLLFFLVVVTKMALCQSYSDTTVFPNKGIYVVTFYNMEKKEKEITYFDDNKLKCIENYDTSGIKSGHCEYWCNNGLKVCEFSANEGKQTYISKYCNGNIMFEGTLCNTPFHLVGKWTVWYENGNLREEGNYNDTEEYTNSHKMGIWRYWSEDGELIKKEVYNDNGVLLIGKIN